MNRTLGLIIDLLITAAVVAFMCAAVADTFKEFGKAGGRR